MFQSLERHVPSILMTGFHPCNTHDCKKANFHKFSFDLHICTHTHIYIKKKHNSEKQRKPPSKCVRGGWSPDKLLTRTSIPKTHRNLQSIPRWVRLRVLAKPCSGTHVNTDNARKTQTITALASGMTIAWVCSLKILLLRSSRCPAVEWAQPMQFQIFRMCLCVPALSSFPRQPLRAPAPSHAGCSV